MHECGSPNIDSWFNLRKSIQLPNWMQLPTGMHSLSTVEETPSAHFFWCIFVSQHQTEASGLESRLWRVSTHVMIKGLFTWYYSDIDSCFGLIEALSVCRSLASSLNWLEATNQPGQNLWPRNYLSHQWTDLSQQTGCQQGYDTWGTNQVITDFLNRFYRVS